VNHWEGLRVF